ncbi:MAG TPA: PAS domain-containing protein, partial [Anaeromyxobacteraceae bacterium]|nr:PAS domain-containing protein [Anaeromyxobacteraceae bacterium]
VTGHTEEDFLAEGFWASHLHPEDAPRVLTGVATVFEKKTHRHQYRFRFKDGTYHWMEDEFRLLEDGAGRPVEICGTWIDITDRKRAETELERHHHHLEEVVAERTAALQVKNSVFDASLAANSIADLHGVLTEVNDAFLRSWGYADKTQVVGTPMSRFLQDPGEAATIIAALDGTGVWEGDFTARRKDGSTFLARGGATVLRDERGTAIGYQSAVLDITERKKAENALQELAGRLERATQAGKVGVWDYDIVRNRLVWDDQMFRLYGVARDRFLGAYEAWENGLHPDDRQSAVTELQAALRGDKEFDTEFRVVWPDGSLRHIKAAGTVQRDGAGKAVRMVGTNMDITERRAAEEALRAAKQAADAASRAKSAFLANMSHEIRTPLNAILGYAQLLQRDPSLSADAREDLETINRSGEHLLGLINSVLEMSKIDAGRVTVQATTFSLHGMLADLASLFRGRTEAKGLTFETVRLGEVPDRVVADEGKVRQVLTNLLGNAVKFTERGGIVLRTSSGKDGAGQLRLAVEVEDTGPGIGEEDLGRLFQHFEQTASGRQVQAGTGLGLAISRAHARLVGGDVTVTSQVGRGSVFRLEVPVQVTAESVVAPTTIRRRVSGLAPGQNAWRVLVADDSAANRGWVTKLLASVGFQVREAADGRETVEAWRQWKPHLVLMDMRMPVLDGYQATRQIRASPGGAETRIIAATASVFEETRQAMTDAGVDGFLGKPIQEADLFQKIQEHLRLDYLFGADEAPTAGPAPAPAVKPESLARLPAETKARMRSAIHSGDMEQLNGLILQVATLDETLASALRSLADRYEYDALSTLLTPESAR